MERTCPTLVQRARANTTPVPPPPPSLTLGSRSVLIYKALKGTQLAGWQPVWGETEETRAQWVSTSIRHSKNPQPCAAPQNTAIVTTGYCDSLWWRAHFASDVSGTRIMSWKCCLTNGCEEVKLSFSCSSWWSTLSSLSMIVWGSMQDTVGWQMSNGSHQS